MPRRTIRAGNFVRAIVAATLSITCGTVPAAHVDQEEVNVAIVYCAIDTTRTPPALLAETISVNATKHPIPPIRPKEPCAQALHEFLTAGFELVNEDTATTVFVLTRRDRAIVKH